MYKSLDFFWSPCIMVYMMNFETKTTAKYLAKSAKKCLTFCPERV